MKDDSPKGSTAPMLFPVAGLNVATEFGRQPTNTTPVGENVRAFESLARRKRGGSRSGLSKHLPVTVPAGAFVIQHLTVVVDPQTPALLADDTINGSPPDQNPPYPEFLDPSTNNNAAGLGPRNPGRFVRVGGSGRPEYRQPPGTMAGTVEEYVVGDGDVSLTFTYDDTAANGSLAGTTRFVHVVTTSDAPPEPPTQVWVSLPTVNYFVNESPASPLHGTLTLVGGTDDKYDPVTFTPD